VIESAVTFPGLPDSIWRSGSVVCAEFCDWSAPTPGNLWIDIAEGVFNALNAIPQRGEAFSCDVEPSQGRSDLRNVGRWKSIRARASRTISTPARLTHLSLNTDYDHIVGENPFDLEVCLQSSEADPSSPSRLTISTADPAQTPESLLHALFPVIQQVFDPKWGAVYRLPKAVGGNFYANNGIFVPRELLPAEEEAYARRVSRICNRWSDQVRYRAGYVREIYELNFLSERHLGAPMGRLTVADYVRGLGAFQASPIAQNLWEWRLSPSELRMARSDWEDSGLVLAAARDLLDPSNLEGAILFRT